METVAVTAVNRLQVLYWLVGAIFKGYIFMRYSDMKANTEFCAGGITQGTATQNSMLEGDSGGPLMLLHNDVWHQIGITSRGSVFSTQEMDKIINYGWQDSI